MSYALQSIYVDHAATTPLIPAAREAMYSFEAKGFYNPSSSYRPAQEMKRVLETARKTLAATIDAQAREIYFTASGTEANNWALKGISESLSSRGHHIIVSAIEHHAVLEPAHWLERHGFEVTYLSADCQGVITPEVLEAALRDDTIMVSIMTANNELGTIEPIRELASCAHRVGAVFHTDAVQAYGHIPLSVSELGIDTLSVSAHKLGGPRGVGFLYRRQGIDAEPLLHGGAQERGARAGTENLAAIVGFQVAAEEACSHLEDYQAHVSYVRDEFCKRIMQAIPDIRINADHVQKLPGHAHVSFKGISNIALLLRLDKRGIYASAGSACASGSLEQSHVLTALGIEPDWAQGSLRFTFGRDNTLRDVVSMVEVLKHEVARLRAL